MQTGFEGLLLEARDQSMAFVLLLIVFEEGRLLMEQWEGGKEGERGRGRGKSEPCITYFITT
jgi:hypothetical protein